MVLKTTCITSQSARKQVAAHNATLATLTQLLLSVGANAASHGADRQPSIERAYKQVLASASTMTGHRKV